MNVVIPFRNTCGTTELNMCVKLIKKNLKLKYEKIIIIGDDCEFKMSKVKNIIVEEQKYNKWIDSSFLVERYISMYHEPFILFNDDFFLTDVVKEIPSYYFDTLSNRLLTTNVIDTKINKLRPSTYGLNIKQFINIYGDFRNYEVHIPMIVEDPVAMKVAIDRCKQDDCPALKRTMYRYIISLMTDGETEDNAVELQHDIKFGEPLKTIQYPFFSLTDKEYDVFEEQFNDILNK